jgi:predicted O-methyltransferase YrrM
MLARLAGARRVLEIGTFTGYATVWLAAAVSESGTVIALERDDRAADVCRRHLRLAGLESRVDLVVGDALEAIQFLPAGTAPFDLVFIDADKKRYIAYYEELLGRSLVSENGFILADNILWKGRVLEQHAAGSSEAGGGAAAAQGVVLASAREKRLVGLRDAMDGFNRHVGHDTRTAQLILPLRDGLSISQRMPQGGDAACFGWQPPLPGLAGVADADGAAVLGATEAAEAGAGASVAERAFGVGSSGAGGYWPGWSTSVGVLQSYLRAVCDPEPAAITALRRESASAFGGGPGLGHGYGRLLHMLARATPSRRVLEVGSFTGCATLWLATAVGEEGTVLALEGDERAAAMCVRHLRSAALDERVRMLGVGGAVADSVACLPVDSTCEFDLIVLHGEGSGAIGSSDLEAVGAAASRWLSPNGVIVARIPAGARPAPLHGERAKDCGGAEALDAVVLPSPDGDGLSVVLFGRRAAWECSMSNHRPPTVCQSCQLCEP